METVWNEEKINGLKKMLERINEIKTQLAVLSEKDEKLNALKESFIIGLFLNGMSKDNILNKIDDSLRSFAKIVFAKYEVMELFANPTHKELTDKNVKDIEALINEDKYINYCKYELNVELNNLCNNKKDLVLVLYKNGKTSIQIAQYLDYDLNIIRGIIDLHYGRIRFAMSDVDKCGRRLTLEEIAIHFPKASCTCDIVKVLSEEIERLDKRITSLEKK